MNELSFSTYVSSFSTLSKRKDGLLYMMASSLVILNFSPFLKGLNDVYIKNKLADDFSKIFGYNKLHYIIIVQYVVPRETSKRIISPKYYHERQGDWITNFRIIEIDYRSFFTRSWINKVFISSEKLHSGRSIIVIFRDTKWSTVVTKFRLFGIVVSGGVKTSRHLISPHQLKLSVFISLFIKILGGDIMKYTHDSFYSKEKYNIKYNQPIGDFTRKGGVLDFIEKNKETILEEYTSEPIDIIKKYINNPDYFSDDLNLKINKDNENDDNDLEKNKESNSNTKNNPFSNGQKREYHTSPKSLELNKINYLNWKKINKFNFGSCFVFGGSLFGSYPSFVLFFTSALPFINLVLTFSIFVLASSFSVDGTTSAFPLLGLAQTPFFISPKPLEIKKINYLDRDMLKKYELGDYKVEEISKFSSFNLNHIIKFLSILDKKKIYVLFPLLLSESAQIISISAQILVVGNINSQLLYNFIDKQINLLTLKHYPIDYLGSSIIFKYREITINTEMDLEEVIFNLSKSDFEKSPKDSVNLHNINTNSFIFKDVFLPFSMLSYGTRIDSDDIQFKQLVLHNPESNLDYQKVLYAPLGFKEFMYLIYLDKKYVENGCLTHECIFFKGLTEYLRFKDVADFSKPFSFNRFIDNYNIRIEKGKLCSINTEIKFKYIKPLKQTKNINNILNKKLVTFDIETYKNNKNIFIPYACGWYNGEITKTYYLTDFKSYEDMIIKSITDLILENDRSSVYIHNLSNFDYILINKILYNHFNVRPQFKDGEILSLSISIKNDIKSIKMFDSYRILTLNLRDLAIKYKVNTLKGNFPYDFVKENNLNYIGKIPKFSFYKDLEKELYKKISKDNNKWDLKKETVNYLISDIKSLHEVIKIFFNEIISNEKINPLLSPTISSIGFKIFKTNYLGKNNLPIVTSIAHKNMRKAYFGGIVDVFKCHGFNLKMYDINSLYPFSMLKPMPVGKIIFSTSRVLEDYFGIVFASINRTNSVNGYLYYPCLPCNIDGRNYNPTGKWSGWYFSEELKFASKYGYKIKIHYGYTFEKEYNIFENYVKHFYSVKSGNSPDISMDKNTAKLLLNSLYGRMGLNPFLDHSGVFNKEDASKIITKYVVKEQYSITDKLEYLRYSTTPINNLDKIYSDKEYKNILIKTESEKIDIDQSLPIAIATTAYARMYMFDIIYRLVEKGITIYYMDTDSIVIDKNIPDTLIGSELGLFKKVCDIKEGIFVAPKLYYLKTSHDKANTPAEIIKAKGVGKDLSRSDFIKLLKNDVVKIKKERWFRNKPEAKIQSKNITIQIKNNSIKRKRIYKRNKMSYTMPLEITNDNIKST